MYLYVLLVNDTIEASDLLCLLGVGLLKLAQTLVYLAQTISMSVQLFAIVFGAKISIFIHMANHDLHPLTQTFDLRKMQKRISCQINC